MSYNNIAKRSHKVYLLLTTLQTGSMTQFNIIRTYHECEGRIEKSVPRIVIWHHEACWVMTNGYSEGRILLPYPHKNNEFFILLTTLFIYLF